MEAAMSVTRVKGAFAAAAAVALLAEMTTRTQGEIVDPARL